MNSLLLSCSSAILSRAGKFVLKSPVCGFSPPSRRTRFQYASIRASNLSINFSGQFYSTKRSGKGRSKGNADLKSVVKANPDIKPVVKDAKEAFYVVRKGDLVSLYKSLSDCQAQVGSSIRDPPVCVYKGYSMTEDTEKYLMAIGLKNALYTIRASDVTDELFGTLVPCPFQRSCILEFDGASKGNPGRAGAGAVLRSNDGILVCRLREGLGTATNNVAEYRAMILGLKYALQEGFTNILVRGDSKLVCMQIQGLWRARNENIANLYEEAKKLKDRFLLFEITHVLREFNSEADAQANLAAVLAVGEVEEEIDK